jgi:hypothetical protein
MNFFKSLLIVALLSCSVAPLQVNAMAEQGAQAAVQGVKQAGEAAVSSGWFDMFTIDFGEYKVHPTFNPLRDPVNCAVSWYKAFAENPWKAGAQLALPIVGAYAVFLWYRSNYNHQIHQRNTIASALNASVTTCKGYPGKAGCSSNSDCKKLKKIIQGYKETALKASDKCRLFSRLYCSKDAYLKQLINDFYGIDLDKINQLEAKKNEIMKYMFGKIGYLFGFL